MGPGRSACNGRIAGPRGNRLTVTPIDLYPIAYTTGRADLGCASGLFRDDFFFHRVTSHQVGPAGLNEFERRHYRSHRWWTHAELATTPKPSTHSTQLP